MILTRIYVLLLVSVCFLYNTWSGFTRVSRGIMGRVIHVNDTLVLFIAKTMVLATDWEARIMEGCEEIGEVSIGVSMH